VDTGTEITTVWDSVGAIFRTAPVIGLTGSGTTGGGGIAFVTGIGVEFRAYDQTATSRPMRALGYVGVKAANTGNNLLGMNHLAETRTRLEWDAFGEVGALFAPSGSSQVSGSGIAPRFGYPQASWDATKAMATVILRRRAVLPDPTIAYSELGPDLHPLSFEPNSAAFHEMLGEISTEEDVAGRGMLSVLVVHKQGDQMPGGGFFRLAASRGRDISDLPGVWRTELDYVVAYWQSNPAS
jgi:hypothetical protein